MLAKTEQMLEAEFIILDEKVKRLIDEKRLLSEKRLEVRVKKHILDYQANIPADKIKRDFKKLHEIVLYIFPNFCKVDYDLLLEVKSGRPLPRHDFANKSKLIEIYSYIFFYIYGLSVEEISSIVRYSVYMTYIKIKDGLRFSNTSEGRMLYIQILQEFSVFFENNKN